MRCSQSKLFHEIILTFFFFFLAGVMTCLIYVGLYIEESLTIDLRFQNDYYVLLAS